MEIHREDKFRWPFVRDNAGAEFLTRCCWSKLDVGKGRKVNFALYMHSSVLGVISQPRKNDLIFYNELIK